MVLIEYCLIMKQKQGSPLSKRALHRETFPPSPFLLPLCNSILLDPPNNPRRPFDKRGTSSSSSPCLPRSLQRQGACLRHRQLLPCRGVVIRGEATEDRAEPEGVLQSTVAHDARSGMRGKLRLLLGAAVEVDDAMAVVEIRLHGRGVQQGGGLFQKQDVVVHVPRDVEGLAAGGRADAVLAELAVVRGAK